MSKREITVRHRGGIGVFDLLGVLFVGLKLAGYIDWSWWWVTLPFWGGIALVFSILALIGMGAAVVAIIEHIQDRRRYSIRKR